MMQARRYTCIFDMRKKLSNAVRRLIRIDSIIGLVGVCFILAAALSVQIFYGETPCPLCLLQRAAFVNIGLAMMLNIFYKNRVAHWAMATLSACAGIAVSMRQILLHITSPHGFGSAFLGLHMYTWCFIVFFSTIVGCTLMLVIYPEKKRARLIN